MKRRIAIAILILLPAPLSGCGWIQPPRLVAPGPVGYQQSIATRFDPYPDAANGPDVVGGRPRGFQNPVTKKEYSQPITQPVWLGAPAYSGFPQ